MERKYLTEWKRFLNEDSSVDPKKFYKIVFDEVKKIEKTIQDMNPAIAGKPSELQVTQNSGPDYQRYNLQIKTPGIAQTQNWTNLATVDAFMLLNNSFGNLKNFWIRWKQQFDTMTFAKKLRNNARFDLDGSNTQLMSIARAVNNTAMASKQVFDQQIDRFDAATSQTPG